MESRIFNEYPNEISNMLNTLINIYDKECKSIILYGSTAHNGLTYRKIKNQFEFLSDIEFIVVPNDSVNEDNKEFEKKLMKKSFDYLKENSSIVFPPYVDVNSVSKDFFIKAQLRISTFELKNNGKVVKGDNLLKLLPTVNQNNYSYKVQNIEIVKALKILLIESNKWFLCEDSYFNQKYEEQFCYFLCSSFLNILRTLLPIFGIFELTNQERVNQVLKLKNNKTVLKFFSENLLEQFEKVLIQKNEAIFNYKPHELFLLAFNGYKCLISLLIKNNNSDLLENVENNKHELFDGTDCKIKQLSQLTCFFIASLNCIESLIKNNSICDLDIEKSNSYLDTLIAGKNSYRLMCMINEYGNLEKTRWKIIGSKD